MYSVTNESIKNIKLLIKYGADVNMCTIMDETALDLAIKLGNKHIIRLLLVHGSKMTWNRSVSVNAIKIMLNILMY
jgi:ankyrin repeat protein